MSTNIQAKYLSTDKTCVYFDLSSQYLMDKKRNGLFIKGVHYIQPSTKLLRWNIEELEKELGSTLVTNSNNTFETNSDIDISNFLK